MFLRGSPGTPTTRGVKMVKGQLSNTEKAALNMIIAIGAQKYSFFDEGITEGSGIWYSALVEETPLSPRLAARAVTKLVKEGRLIKSDKDEDGEQWVELTAHGAKIAQGLATETPLVIVEDEAAPTTRKAPTAQVAEGTGCKCGCGTQVQGKKALYRPGHDAKHVSRLVAETRTTGKQPAEASQLSTRLFAKFVKALTK
ncbi:hypothetical protein FDH63_gp56 [Arthrobacter phage Wayne]|uniref:Uncharacterized protein n=2 Tax=Korravirus wayne TaxID=1982085 RepID=A0A0U4B7R0_9CAUD|nr:hypothetical protein FDH63_gp56 [Arthrobacter phage Wayne]ALY10781.1 hypothetical protein PBI_WAYNE_57 [Arthrobacter phage Wayne]